MYTLFYRINYGVSIRIIYRDIIQCLLADFNSVPERTPISCTAGFRKAKQSRIAPVITQIRRKVPSTFPTVPATTAAVDGRLRFRPRFGLGP